MKVHPQKKADPAGAKAKPLFCTFQWGSSVFLCYKKSVSASNTISYKAGESVHFWGFTVFPFSFTVFFKVSQRPYPELISVHCCVPPKQR